MQSNRAPRLLANLATLFLVMVPPTGVERPSAKSRSIGGSDKRLGQGCRPRFAKLNVMMFDVIYIEDDAPENNSAQAQPARQPPGKF